MTLAVSELTVDALDHQSWGHSRQRLPAAGPCGESALRGSGAFIRPQLYVSCNFKYRVCTSIHVCIHLINLSSRDASGVAAITKSLSLGEVVLLHVALTCINNDHRMLSFIVS